jgi:8-oxo-dGTP pyrophosphatase MutT (NUDIX family)/predicted GNAT family acetyltransferase
MAQTTANQEAMSMLLLPPGACPLIGLEAGKLKETGISVLRSPTGSIRYVYAVDGTVISALQVMKDRDGRAVATNVYTDPGHRRKGYAKELAARARLDFPSMALSDERTSDGAAWAQAIHNHDVARVTSIQSHPEKPTTRPNTSGLSKDRVMEKFAWARSIRLESPYHIKVGEGYLCMKPEADPQAIGRPKDIVNGLLPGHLISAGTILKVVDEQNNSKWLMLKRDEGAPSYPGHWQFPAGRMSVGETPLECARRELIEEVRLTSKGELLDLAQANYSLGHETYAWEGSDGVTQAVAGQHIFYDNTVDFYFIATIKVPDLNDVLAFDNEPYGRVVKLLTEEEITSMVQSGRAVCPASAMQWDQLIEQDQDEPRPESKGLVPALG